MSEHGSNPRPTACVSDALDNRATHSVLSVLSNHYMFSNSLTLDPIPTYGKGYINNLDKRPTERIMITHNNKYNQQKRDNNARASIEILHYRHNEQLATRDINVN